MRVIVPIVVDETNLTSNVPEADHDAYAAGTAYATGDNVIYEHRIYESLQDANTGNTPDSSSTWWLDTGATNRYKMFDEFVNTQTENANEIDVTIATTDLVGGLALFELDADSVQVICTDGVTEVYNYTLDLMDYSVPDYYEYFFSPYILIRDLHILDLPPYPGMDVRIKVTYTGGTAKCGAAVLGQDFDAGMTKWGPRIGIISFSRKIRDDFGRIYLKQGNSSKRASIDLHVENGNVDYLQRSLAAIDGIACVFVGDTRDNNFQSLAIYGFFRDFEITIPGPAMSSCTIELEGLI